ncbi:MAG TPA: hypothetical protein VIH37_04720 [Candidatus Limnocylindrales bacterium]
MTPSARLARSVSLVAALGLAVAALVVPAQSAQAANLAMFDPGYLISDTVMYDAGAMNADQIQAFLQAKGASCVPNTTDGSPCLKDYHQATASRAATERCTQAYQGAADESAATILAKVAAACGINPRVLIVTLQKEQSLVTRTTSATKATYDKALGFGCPDTAGCDPAFSGFFLQVYAAAAQLRNYALHPSNYSYRAGAVNSIMFNPNAACGSSQVLIRNQATASLYDYTPYQPNAIALSVGYGAVPASSKDGVYTTNPNDGDCASYGNRNFWLYFTDWFGSTYSENPVGFLDAVTPTGGDSVQLQGWALDPDTFASIPVHLYVDGVFNSQIVANTSRPDIASAYPGWGDAHGFNQTVVVGAGQHTVCAYAINQGAGDTNPGLGCATVTVVNHAPIGFYDGISATKSTITVSGWAYDQDRSDPVQIQIRIGSQLITTGAADQPRLDVAAAVPGAGGQRGFSIEFPVAAGTQQVCLTALNLPSGPGTSLGCKTITVVNALPIGFVDQVVGGTGSISVAGWAWDSDAGGPIGVHVYVDNAFAGATTTTVARPDVAAAIKGAGPTTGYALTVPAAAGTHTVCVYAINGPAGVNPLLACKQGVAVG